MAMSPKAISPQPDFRLSDAVRQLEMELAKAEHLAAKRWHELQRAQSDIQFWKNRHTEICDQLTAERHERKGD